MTNLRILSLSDVQGNINSFNELYKKEDSKVDLIIHTGNFGFWDSKTVDSENSDVNYLKQIIAFSEVLDQGIVNDINNLSIIESTGSNLATGTPGNLTSSSIASSHPSSSNSNILLGGDGSDKIVRIKIQASISSSPSTLPTPSTSTSSKGISSISQLEEYLNGTLVLPCPVYTIFGPLDDPRVVYKFQTGEYSIPNLYLIDHTKCYEIPTPLAEQPNIRLYGLGGTLKIHSLFDHGKLEPSELSGTLCGKVGDLWISMFQIATMYHNVMKSSSFASKIVPQSSNITTGGVDLRGSSSSGTPESVTETNESTSGTLSGLVYDSTTGSPDAEISKEASDTNSRTTPTGSSSTGGGANSTSVGVTGLTPASSSESTGSISSDSDPTTNNSLSAGTINIFVSHSPIVKTPLLEHIAIMTNSDFSISQGLHFRYPVMGNGMSYVDSMGGSAGYIESYRLKFSRLRMILGELWVIVKDSILEILEASEYKSETGEPSKEKIEQLDIEEFKRLLELGLSLFDKIPVSISDPNEIIMPLTLRKVNPEQDSEKDATESQEELESSKKILKKINDMYFSAYYNLWHFNLCDLITRQPNSDRQSDYNYMIFNLDKFGDFRLENCTSQGFNFNFKMKKKDERNLHNDNDTNINKKNSINDANTNNDDKNTNKNINESSLLVVDSIKQEEPLHGDDEQSDENVGTHLAQDQQQDQDQYQENEDDETENKNKQKGSKHSPSTRGNSGRGRGGRRGNGRGGRGGRGRGAAKSKAARGGCGTHETMSS